MLASVWYHLWLQVGWWLCLLLLRYLIWVWLLLLGRELVMLLMMLMVTGVRG